MKGNGTKIGFTIAFLVISVYYLQFSIRYWILTGREKNLQGQAKTEYVQKHQKQIDNLRPKILNLGLDLQGGMHVTLQLQTQQLLKDLAKERADSTLNHALDIAAAKARKNNTDVVDEFVQTFETRDPNARLSRYYRSEADNITRRSSNADVVKYLQKQRNSAVKRAIQIIRTRIDRFGVNEPSIVKQGQNRIAVELPGVKDEERVRNLLKGTARLEFRLCADPQELQTSLKKIVSYYNNADTTAKVDTSAQQASKNNPLLKVMVPEGRSVVFGAATAADSAMVDSLLGQPAVRQMLPRDVTLLWTAKPGFTGQNGKKYFNLIGVKKQVELNGDVIVEARPTFDRYTNQPEVSMTMNREGARKWARITGANIGKPIAIILDGYVYTYPNVQTKISDGRSSITGLGSVQESQDLVNILMSGALPAPLDIVQVRTVGPTLGQASIHSGFSSTIIGLIIVALFMIAYYNKGGGIADMALIFNMIFILGILAAFKATLTLPGIAGIVLTIGMAVDANVLIFERVREEQAVGKSMRAAIDSGYSNAMSAILDSNITTFLTGVILYSFGVGPIKGFAVTLMAGIVSSLFTAIVITRIVVDYMTRDKNAVVNFG
ncbi:MAG TPA: protein translocase subunit SecD [Balneolaceae bacterium]|nr:protein translocase subunit SecD [Balneolales bacterium]HKK45342.1 protein translocase subunit SecD [Balneolaceae bacterium]